MVRAFMLFVILLTSCGKDESLTNWADALREPTEDNSLYQQREDEVVAKTIASYLPAGTSMQDLREADGWIQSLDSRFFSLCGWYCRNKHAYIENGRVNILMAPHLSNSSGEYLGIYAGSITKRVLVVSLQSINQFARKSIGVRHVYSMLLGAYFDRDLSEFFNETAHITTSSSSRADEIERLLLEKFKTLSEKK